METERASATTVASSRPAADSSPPSTSRSCQPKSSTPRSSMPPSPPLGQQARSQPSTGRAADTSHRPLCSPPRSINACVRRSAADSSRPSSSLTRLARALAANAAISVVACAVAATGAASSSDRAAEAYSAGSTSPRIHCVRAAADATAAGPKKPPSSLLLATPPARLG